MVGLCPCTAVGPTLLLLLLLSTTALLSLALRPLMVVDRLGGIVFATQRLAQVLGYSLRALLQMNFAALMPQPFKQMVGGWWCRPRLETSC